MGYPAGNKQKQGKSEMRWLRLFMSLPDFGHAPKVERMSQALSEALKCRVLHGCTDELSLPERVLEFESHLDEESYPSLSINVFSSSSLYWSDRPHELRRLADDANSIRQAMTYLLPSINHLFLTLICFPPHFSRVLTSQWIWTAQISSLIHSEKLTLSKRFLRNQQPFKIGL